MEFSGKTPLRQRSRDYISRGWLKTFEEDLVRELRSVVQTLRL